MPIQKSLVRVCAAVFLFAGTALAQTAATPATSTAAATKTTSVPDGGVPTFLRAETPEQRKQRLGTVEDPGMDPDPKTKFWRFGKSMHIEKYERKWAAYDAEDKNFIRPFSFTVASFELYQHNDKYVWVWVPDQLTLPPAEAAKQTAPADPYNDATYEFLKRVRPQFTTLVPPASTKTIRFQESSAGLPTSGSWRVSATVADMNGDKCPDIIAPPERKGNGAPVIFLGDCKGNWKYWNDAQFPVQMDYGSIVAADFNKDGHMDLAVAVHLNGLFVLLGDGKGKFKSIEKGLPHDFPTRRVVVADVDRDGAPDIVALSEGPSDVQTGADTSPVRAYLNRKKGTEWMRLNIAPSGMKVGGDWMSTGDFNGDSYPDFATSSVFYGTMEVVYVSSSQKTIKKWVPYESDGDVLPSLSYYFASTAGKFTSKKRDDAIISYVRFWPGNVNPDRVPKPELPDVTSVDLLTFDEGKAVRTPLARWAGRTILAVGSGDFDHDGNLDVICLLDKPREPYLLLGDGKGGFTSAKVDGLSILANPIYDIRVADVNADGRPDVVLMYESAGKTAFAQKDGAIRVFLDVATSDGAISAGSK